MYIPGFAPAPAPAAPTPPTPARSKKPYSVGVLFVHGMGEQERGDTLTEGGDALTEWLRQWIEPLGDAADFKIRGAILRTGEMGASGQTDDSLAGEAHVAVTINTRNPGTKRMRRQDWLLAESWWAQAFRQATLLELVVWAIAAGPWLIASQRAGISRRVRPNFIVASILTLLGALVAAVISPLAVAMLLLSAIPVPLLSSLARAAAKNLTGSFGDLLILVRSPVRFAAMAEQVRADIAHVHAHCDKVLVVAHSQGSAVAWHAIRRTSDDPPAQRARVDIFLSFGQAFRKLESLYRLQHEPGIIQLQFAVAALASTALLVLVAVQGIGLWNAIIEMQGDIGRAWHLIATDWYWLELLWPVAGVVALQRFLGNLASDNDEKTEPEIITHIKEVQEVFDGFRWQDEWASADPAPNGPLLDTLPAGVVSYRVRNRASTLFDHPVYWSNVTEFVSSVAFAAASLAPPSAIGTTEPIPPALVDAAALRDRRVSMLGYGRVLPFSALVTALFGVRRDLDNWGSALLNWLNGLSFLPHWFGGWPFTLRVLLVAALLALAAGIVWTVLYWGWTFVIRTDEAAFFKRDPGQPWSTAAAAWVAVAALVPTATMVALSAWRGDWRLFVGYLVVSAAGIQLVRWLNSPGRRFGDPPPTG